jgi:hypothetical protein
MPQMLSIYLLTKKTYNMKIKLLSDRILVKPNAKERNSFGIILPENQKTETKVLLYW